MNEVNKNMKHIEDIAKKLGEEHHIHISALPRYFGCTILGWEVDVISFNKSVPSIINALGRYDTKNKALSAGVDYIKKQLGL